MCKSYFLSDLSQSSDTRTKTQKTYELPENILRGGGEEVDIHKPPPDSPEGEKGVGVMNSTSLNSPQRNRGGGRLINPTFPNSPRRGARGEGVNISSPNSPNK